MIMIYDHPDYILYKVTVQMPLTTFEHFRLRTSSQIFILTSVNFVAGEPKVTDTILQVKITT